MVSLMLAIPGSVLDRGKLLAAYTAVEESGVDALCGACGDGVRGVSLVIAELYFGDAGVVVDEFADRLATIPQRAASLATRTKVKRTSDQ